MVVMALPALWCDDPAAVREWAMVKVLRFVRGWLLLSVPVGIAAGKFIKAGKGPPLRDEDRR